MQGYTGNIEKETLENSNFRKVLYTSKYSQLVLMTLKPGEEIGAEIHETHDQFFRFEAGTGKVLLDGVEHIVKDGDAAIATAGINHNVINAGDNELKLYTIYSPPEHRDGIVHATKKEAEADDEEFDGKTTE